MDVTIDYIDFYLNAPQYLVALECLEITHPGFTKPYYIVKNATNGITVTHEDGQEITYEYWPCSIKRTTITNDLSSGIEVDLGDLGEILPTELKAGLSYGDGSVKPLLIYRIYRSDNLKKPMDGPFKLQIKQFSYNRQGVSFTAMAPAINNNVTGELYDLQRFESLRYFLY